MQLTQLDNLDSNVLIEEDQRSVPYQSKEVHSFRFEGNAINFFDKTNKKKERLHANQSATMREIGFFLFLSQSNRRMTGRVNAYILIWGREIK